MYRREAVHGRQYALVASYDPRQYGGAHSFPGPHREANLSSLSWNSARTNSWLLKRGFSESGQGNGTLSHSLPDGCVNGKITGAGVEQVMKHIQRFPKVESHYCIMVRTKKEYMYSKYLSQEILDLDSLHTETFKESYRSLNEKSSPQKESSKVTGSQMQFPVPKVDKGQLKLDQLKLKDLKDMLKFMSAVNRKYDEALSVKN
ncbi:hypothetical protein PoB_005209800 [Plakobranchus ocellatus]|uniref:Uncharacterized protein n=1 Tax=Plakobranchus ocellatus TaxID=259542 RepID=A0AAV4C2E5_9GAST|nr:hypothetical protein PoB_005209800 [Plakobranchus ocellatus]